MGMSRRSQQDCLQTPGSTEQVRGRRGPPSRELPRPGGHWGNGHWTCWEVGLPRETARENGNLHNQVSALLKRRKQKIRRVCWLSVLDCGNWQHQSPAPAAPRATTRPGGEETSGMAVPVRRCCLCSHTRAHLENGRPGRWALSSGAGRQPEELEPFSACREAEVGQWKGCQLLDGNTIS